jgi:hypothetical protein
MIAAEPTVEIVNAWMVAAAAHQHHGARAAFAVDA